MVGRTTAAEGTDARRPSYPAAALRLFTSLVAAATVVVILLTLAGFAARWWWRFELACHFRLQYAWLLTAGAACLFVLRRRWLGGIAGIFAIANAAAILPIYIPQADRVAADGPPLRIVSFNVLSRNDRFDEVLRYLRHEQADLVLLMEISPAWAEAVRGLADLYPHQHVVPRTDNFGIALLSREPWRTALTIDLGTAAVPTVVAEFGEGSDGFLFVGTHPLPPGSTAMAAERNEQLRAVSEYIAAKRRRTILAGDFNVTSYSPYFGDLVRQAGLRDTRQGVGIQASWGPMRLLEIPIDHCLVSPDIQVLNRRVGNHLGSDHRPVIVDLRILSR